MFAGRVPGVRSDGLSPVLWECRRFVSGSPASFFFVAQPLRSQWDSHSWLSPCLQLSGTAVPGCAPLPLFSLAGHDFSRAEEFEESSKLQPRVLHLSSLWNSHSWLFVFDCIVPSFVLCGGAPVVSAVPARSWLLTLGQKGQRRFRLTRLGRRGYALRQLSSRVAGVDLRSLKSDRPKP